MFAHGMRRLWPTDGRSRTVPSGNLLRVGRGSGWGLRVGLRVRVSARVRARARLRLADT